MPIEDYLIQKEKIRFWSDFQLVYKEEKFRVYITNLRLLLFKEKGIIFGNEEIITENWAQISGLQFSESGRLNKKGQFKYTGSNGDFILEGPKKGMLRLFKVIQKQILDPYDRLS
jgi:hypothetical protein